MNQEYLKDILLHEGFPIVYEWTDQPFTVYERHCHQDKVSFYVIKGEVSFIFENGLKKSIVSGQRFDVPPQQYHTATVGCDGCIYIVGQMNEEDA